MEADLARSLMADFAEATGVSGKAPPRRYLWTDAFAVCNLLGLHRQSGDEQYLDLARRLVDQVHHVLGRHRDDDARRGWISGLSEQDGEQHPTRGGLRIGKSLHERGPDEPLDSELEWDRDGQYFHYLTRWMHALHCMARQTAEHRYLRWAVELAAAAHNAFTYEASPGGPKRMVWKMSVDLSRPLVPSMGHHDPLDGLITYLELQTAEQSNAEDRGDLSQAIADTSEMCGRARWATDDPLGIGGLLDDAARLARMVFRHGVERRELLRQLLVESGLSLQAFARSPLLGYRAERRLAFRELGLSIGVHGLQQIGGLVTDDGELSEIVDELLAYLPLAGEIETFWSQPAHRRSNAWNAHRDINAVMLATSLAPQGYLQV